MPLSPGRGHNLPVRPPTGPMGSNGDHNEDGGPNSSSSRHPPAHSHPGTPTAAPSPRGPPQRVLGNAGGERRAGRAGKGGGSSGSSGSSVQGTPPLAVGVEEGGGDGGRRLSRGSAKGDEP
jgi:hypothetical protein